VAELITKPASVPRPDRNRIASPARWAAVLLGCLLLFYGAMGYFATASYIGENPRWRGMNRGPKDFGLIGDTVSFPSQDGLALKAWWLPANGNARANVIVVHGVDHTRQVMLPRAGFLVRGGYNVLAVDLRGHGESAAKYASPGYLEARDVLGAVHYIRTRGEQGPIAVLGLSYGAVASLLAAEQSPDIAAVIADGAFPTGKDVFDNINRHYLHDRGTNIWLRGLFLISSCPGVPLASSLVYYARTGVYLGPELVSILPAVSRIKVPVLLISGERDWIVPTEQARTILSALPTQRKSIVVIPNAQHDTTFTADPTLYSDAVLTFLGDSLSKQ
jgi:pimeloyl-ACP methyl ester carboxylesterase